ncbi:relaxase domain-containing protein [Micromonospora haikouensis]|uniref:relaxase domain-containing protein n=1 Tax=Micromonospora haikouensis TaxID=686309 RepID=UPI003795D51F
MSPKPVRGSQSVGLSCDRLDRRCAETIDLAQPMSETKSTSPGCLRRLCDRSRSYAPDFGTSVLSGMLAGHEWAFAVLTARHFVPEDPGMVVALAGQALERRLAPRAFAKPRTAARRRGNTLWVGTPTVLQALGITNGAALGLADLVWALSGQSVRSATLPAPEPVVSSIDLTFWVPMSVSWIWALSDQDGQAKLEQGVLNAAADMVSNFPRIQRPGESDTTQGFAAAMVLHATVPAGVTPPPMLHAHCYLVAVLDSAGVIRRPTREWLDVPDGHRLLGALGRLRLSEQVREIGFGIRGGTGPGGRFFEVKGISQDLLDKFDLLEYANCCGSGLTTDFAAQQAVTPPELYWRSRDG